MLDMNLETGPWAGLQSLVKSFPWTFFPLSVKWGWVNDLQGHSSVSILGSHGSRLNFFVLFLSILNTSCYFALVSSACTSVAHDELFQVYSWLTLFPFSSLLFSLSKGFLSYILSLMFLHWILSGLLSPCSSLTQDFFVTWVSEDWPKVCSEGHLCSFRISSSREIVGPWK